MKMLVRTTLAATILGLGLTPAFANLDAGKAAYGKGDYSIALKQFKACLPQPRCQFYLGFMYADGNGVPQDYKEAAKWHRLAADQGDASSQFFLGAMYRNGQGVPQDDKEAAKWFRLSADQGFLYSQLVLGGMYRNGQGVPQDDKEAAKWLRLAADQGDADAQSTLGRMYRNGQGVPQSNKEAIKWYRLAADQGDARALEALGFAYSTGREGVPGSLVLGYALANLAAPKLKSDHAFMNVQMMMQQLSPTDIEIGQQLTNEMRQSGKVTPVIDRYMKTAR